MCFVANDFLRKKKSSTEEDVNSKIRKRSLGSFLKKKFQTVDLGPSPGVLAEMEQKDRAQCQMINAKVRETPLKQILSRTETIYYLKVLMLFDFKSPLFHWVLF